MQYRKCLGDRFECRTLSAWETDVVPCQIGKELVTDFIARWEVPEGSIQIPDRKCLEDRFECRKGSALGTGWSATWEVPEGLIGVLKKKCLGNQDEMLARK